MDKKYQVFISSTYADLKEERRAVIQTLIEADCIPAGMELFPATDEQQLAFIKRVINDCDYYLLIIGGRYGSMSENGISYTEQEYDYAVSRGLKVIALLHENPDQIILGKSEPTPELREKLKQFRAKVSSGRLVKYWNAPHELPALVTVSLVKTIREFPAVGWVRANKPAAEEILAEVHDLRKQKDRLQATLDGIERAPAIEDLAGLDETITLGGRYNVGGAYGYNADWEVAATWRKLFAYISPYLVEIPTDSRAKEILTSALFKETGLGGRSVVLDDQSFRTVAVQLKALGLIELSYAPATFGGILSWSLTQAGERLMMQLRTVRARKAAAKGNEGN